MTFPSLSCWRTCIPRLPRFSGGPGEISLAGTMANSRRIGMPRMRVFGQYALVYLLAGEGMYQDERGVSEKVRAGHWILVFPEIASAYGPTAGGLWHEVYVCFRGSLFECWREAGCLDPARAVGRWRPPAKGILLFANFFRRIQHQRCTSLEAVCLWQNLLLNILGSPEEPKAKHADWLEKALDMLEHSESADAVKEVARACGLGYESFRKKFEKETGMAPWHYVLRRRVERARRLMAMQQLTNKEIAEMLGFYDEFHFSKAFSRLTGKTPRQFRKQMLAHSA